MEWDVGAICPNAAIYGTWGPRVGMALGASVLASVALWGLIGASSRERQALGG